MTSRERMLIIGMAGALVCGGVYVSLSLLSGKRPPPGQDRQKEDILLFAQTQQALIVPLRLGDWERQVLDAAVAPWAASPFIDRGAGADQVVGAPVQEFVYTGYLRVGAYQFAIINGREYRVADALVDTEFSVESIEPDHVVLAATSGGRRMTLPLETVQPQRESP